MLGFTLDGSVAMVATPGIAAMLFWLVTAAVADPAVPPVAECRPAELLGYVPSESDVQAHRTGSLAAVEYDAGDKPGQFWGFTATLRVDESGRVRCYELRDQRERLQTLNPQRRAWLGKLPDLRYRPFAQAGAPVPAIVTEEVSEVARVPHRAPPADVPLADVTLSLARSGCFGTCPSYRVDIRGDGTVTWLGKEYADVQGEHRYRIPVAEVGKLVDSLRAKDLWSANKEYRAWITDNPTYTVTMKLGEFTHEIEDYVGQAVGMPAAVTEFENELDAAAQTAAWIHLSPATIDRLDVEGFDFASAEGTALLWRAAMNDNGSDAAVLGLLQRGARADGAPPAELIYDRDTRLLDTVLRARKSGAADALIAAGALDTAGQPDRAKVDSAFRAAIAGGKVASVERVWSAAGDTARPSLEYDDTDYGGPAKRVSVLFLLDRGRRDAGWEGLRIARWLAEHGADLHARGASGRTLLHIAAGANDLAFVRFLLDEGMDASTPGHSRWLALGGTRNEDVAMLLLEAGSDLSKLDDRGRNFRDYAVRLHWQRVVAWLDTHVPAPQH